MRRLALGGNGAALMYPEQGSLEDAQDHQRIASLGSPVSILLIIAANVVMGTLPVLGVGGDRADMPIMCMARGLFNAPLAAPSRSAVRGAYRFSGEFGTQV